EMRSLHVAEASARWLEPARDVPPQPWPSATASPPQPRRGAFCRCFNVVNLCRHVPGEGADGVGVEGPGNAHRECSLKVARCQGLKRKERGLPGLSVGRVARLPLNQGLKLAVQM